MTSFWKAALIRALRTFAQTAAALIGSTAINIVELDWLSLLGISATAAVASLLTSIATGLPEVAEPEIKDDPKEGGDDPARR